MQALDVAKAFIGVKRAEGLDADGIERLQRKRLELILRYAAQTPHYQNTLAGTKHGDVFDNLSALPIVTKNQLRDNQQSFIPKTINDESMLVETTSGSTGNPLQILLEPDSKSHRIATQYLLETRYGRSPFELFARLHYRPHDLNPLLKATGMFPKLFLSVFDPEEKSLSAIKQSKVKMLRGYPSILSVMAKLNDGFKLRGIMSGGEVLTEDSRKLISDSFSCEVFNHYGCMEAGTVAAECKQHKLHVHPFNIVEIVNAKGKPVKSSTGEVVITPLHNRAMPLIRYHLGDRCRWGKCSCGNPQPVLEKVEGRKEDVIVLPSGKVRSGLSINPMFDVYGILSYQIIQEAPDQFVFRYVPNGTLDISCKREIFNKINMGCLNEKVKIEFECVDNIKRGKTGKIRTVVSKVKVPK